MSEIRFHALADGGRNAFRHTPGTGPALVFLPGYRSDMSGSKATAVFEWAQAQGRACLLLDYSGCGASSGEFADGTLTRWRDEVIALIDAACRGPIILIGSSMGGWLMLLAALELGTRVVGLIGIAAAPDFTQWGFDDTQKAALARGETVFQASPCGPEPTPTYPGLWRDGQTNRVLDGTIALDCPVRLLHGLQDRDVPFDIALRLARCLRSADVQATLIKDGDHRLSRECDIALLLRTIAALAETAP